MFLFVQRLSTSILAGMHDTNISLFCFARDARIEGIPFLNQEKREQIGISTDGPLGRKIIISR